MLIDEGIIILERLRVARGYRSQEKFVNDVCDVRQYRRYLSGSSSMPSGIFFFTHREVKHEYWRGTKVLSRHF